MIKNQYLSLSITQPIYSPRRSWSSIAATKDITQRHKGTEKKGIFVALNSKYYSRALKNTVISKKKLS